MLVLGNVIWRTRSSSFRQWPYLVLCGICTRRDLGNRSEAECTWPPVRNRTALWVRISTRPVPAAPGSFSLPPRDEAYGSYCGAHGALASLAFGQVFGGKCPPKSRICAPPSSSFLLPAPTRRHLGAVVHVPVRASDQVRSFASREGTQDCLGLRVPGLCGFSLSALRLRVLGLCGFWVLGLRV